MFFRDRVDAGEKLAQLLTQRSWRKPLLMALPRGGVPVALPISQALHIPLELLLVRKIGAPFHSEVALGAICESEQPLWSETLLSRLGVDPHSLENTLARERARIKEYARKFRQGLPLPSPRGKTVIVVDDGLATGATMKAAVQFLRKKGADQIVVAIPIAAKGTADHLREVADEVISVHEPRELRAVGDWYGDFTQVEEQEVLELLEKSRNLGVEQIPKTLQEAIRESMVPLKAAQDFNALIQRIRGARVVMLGESTHGTDEFYRLRRILTQRLLEEEGFKFVAVEGDWPDAHRVHRFLQTGEGENARKVLAKNRRWPTWMWANEETVKLVEWMKGRSYGFYGLDVYSLFESMNSVVEYLKKNFPEAQEEVEKNYDCFHPFAGNEIAYARSLLKKKMGCEAEVLKNLEVLLRLRMQSLKGGSDEFFSIEQNARIVANAEAYYRAMLFGDANSWNVRDGHMMETLDRLLERNGEGSKAIVWAHNTHIGDYRATEMMEQGYVNLGGLARQSYGEDNVALVGLSSYQGELLASRAWSGRAEVMTLPPAMEGSIEAHFHAVAQEEGIGRYYCLMPDHPHSPLAESHGHRAIGVVYRPEGERKTQYVPTMLAKRYDAFLFVDRSSALRTLRTHPVHGTLPETWPSGQ